MYLTAEEYCENRFNFRVYLGDEDVTERCIGFDTKEGWVEVHKRDSNGKFYLESTGTEIKDDRWFGLRGWLIRKRNSYGEGALPGFVLKDALDEMDRLQGTSTTEIAKEKLNGTITLVASEETTKEEIQGIYEIYKEKVCNELC